MTLRSALRPARARLVVAVVAYVVKDSPVWALPAVTAAVVDAVVRGGPASRLLLLGAAAMVLVLLNYPVAQVWVRIWSRTVRDLGVALRSRLAGRLQELSLGFHARSSSSVMQTKLVRDVENVELMLQQAANPVLSALGVGLGAIAVVALQVPGFLVLFALVVPVAATLVRSVRRRSEVRNERFRQDVERFSARVGEMASLLPVTRAHGLEPVAAERVVSGAREVRDSGYRLDRLNGRFSAAAWVAFQLLSICCLVGAALASVGGLLPITAGQVVMLSTYFVMLTNSLVALLGTAPLVTKGRESLRSIGEVLQDPDVERNEGKRAPGPVHGALRFEGVGFRYPGTDEWAVRDLDLVVEQGSTVAFVGRSGSGKSTVLNLALGFLRPDRGRILLDDADMDELDLRLVRHSVSVVPQESVLFDGSIRDNIVFGLPPVDDPTVWAALAAANARALVEALPRGLDETMGDRGARLSGGQRQRISIARALIRDPRILLLDEATSALDSESERSVQQALARLRQGRTTLVVAHRLSTVRDADLIVVLDEGRAVERGTHADLLAAGGVYAGLHALQAG